MHLEGGVLAELGAAFSALIRLGARVRSLVHLQSRLGAERFAAAGADVPQVAAFVDLSGEEKEVTQWKPERSASRPQAPPLTCL